MRLRATFLPGLLAGALPLAGVAQVAAPAAPKPQYFVGLGASIGVYQLPTGGSVNVISPTLMVGAQLRPRLAIQANAAYYQQNDSYFYPGSFYINGRQQFGTSNAASHQRTVAVPVLARYTLSRRPAHRLQADLLGGLALVHAAYRSAGTITDSVQTVVSNYEYHTATTGFYFVLGPSLRYRAGQHVDLTSDFVFNLLLNNRSSFSPSRASATLALGLRYRFARG